MDFEFTDGMNEDFEEDPMLLAIGEYLMEIDAAPALITPDRNKEFDLAYDAAEYLQNKYGYKISYKKHEPFKSMGSIYIEGKNIVINECRLLMALYRLCDNLDIYPLSNGDVRMALTFHGIAMPLV